MENLYSPRGILRLSEKYGIRSSKGLGQNFLIDGNIVDKIIAGSGIGPEDLAIEVGPGFGALTVAAAEQAAAVAAIEIDRHLQPALEENLVGYSNVEVFWEDVLKADLPGIIAAMEEKNGGSFAGIQILGNLPYYITTPVIMKFLEELISWDKPSQHPVKGLTFMMQKEVADRIRALPGSKTYGALSVAVQYRCNVELVAAVPKEVFLPRPKVDSAVLHLQVRESKPVAVKSERTFFAVVKSGFGQRRKTLSNALSGVCGLEKERALTALQQAGIDPIRRAETLSLEEFAAIANAVDAIRSPV